MSGPALPAVLQARLAGLVDTLRETEAMVREEHPDGVHDLRVAMRRTRSLLATFGRELGIEQGSALADELRRCGRVLSPLRDVEVVGERLRGHLDGPADEPDLEAVRARVTDHLCEAREAPVREVGGLLGSPRWGELVTELADLAATAPHGTRKKARKRLRADGRRLRRRIERAEEPTLDEDAREQALHRVRKAAKRTRYAAETVAPIFGDDASRLERAAEEVQEALGTHRDTLLTRQVLRRLGVQAHVDGDNAFLLGRLHALEETAGRTALDDYEKARAALDERSLRRWLD
jgi:CHAD domain-containing protein